MPHIPSAISGRSPPRGWQALYPSSAPCIRSPFHSSSSSAGAGAADGWGSGEGLALGRLATTATA